MFREDTNVIRLFVSTDWLTKIPTFSIADLETETRPWKRHASWPWLFLSLLAKSKSKVSLVRWPNASRTKIDALWTLQRCFLPSSRLKTMPFIMHSPISSVCYRPTRIRWRKIHWNGSSSSWCHSSRRFLLFINTRVLIVQGKARQTTCGEIGLSTSTLRDRKAVDRCRLCSFSPSPQERRYPEGGQWWVQVWNNHAGGLGSTIRLYWSTVCFL